MTACRRDSHTAASWDEQEDRAWLHEILRQRVVARRHLDTPPRQLQHKGLQKLRLDRSLDLSERSAPLVEMGMAIEAGVYGLVQPGK